MVVEGRRMNGSCRQAARVEAIALSSDIQTPNSRSCGECIKHRVLGSDVCNTVDLDMTPCNNTTFSFKPQPVT